MDELANGENREICHCKKVSYVDIERVLHNSKKFSDVERAFAEVQKQTHCSTGCGKCQKEIEKTISEIMSA
ncbi:(2Fe-2S)-binding protein [Treponema brennaborense]|uniref:BFD domain protein (2Fe-2S)-binding domain protein n=1 Tax=Treponema brennaborense (strain DSM 12168 / CIP 105900 / DD5/3) TaxID=906968 RepID=F4LK56_TREBD|nr:(2Fe-2S)-binding protein [Treponema brennaborense]AEE17518.1 BFD domain protein (2Fe-2S)-binding domain protein [Treponema brennaborense DSM 12168]